MNELHKSKALSPRKYCKSNFHATVAKSQDSTSTVNLGHSQTFLKNSVHEVICM